ncbi:Peptidase family M28 [Muriicola jejuensis]|uniref:Carboxypeptidase Q n=1 Tax=Muriicola jejuensis TaxID=504488 RepID=A0A6P0UCQ2_9FLAO|nr:M20/M25/M40 family metallo-hydrolase [Muriicola jejuensis]NER09679.1 M20/M25/M40 family metallo-hydrolase [Muriicola jejuensis]SMP06684.1 Peptidase family M28 [Muriicola jejuensis]
MKKIYFLLFLISGILFIQAQTPAEMAAAFEKEATENSHLPKLAHELMDVVGPRLVGTPQMKNAHDWAVSTFAEWGISAKNEAWGTWRGWERGITHIDMLSPRVVSLSGRQLAWSPGTSSKGITAHLITIPTLTDSLAFAKWVSSVKGKFVLVSMPQPTGRPDYNWEEFATPESFEKMKADRDAMEDAWNQKIRNTGYNSRTINEALEKAGASGIVQSRWSSAFGANKIFSANTKKIPVVDLSLEDYGMLYRLVENGSDPLIRIVAESKELGRVPTFNTIATIPGTEFPDEYIVLSAHFDSWDGGTGATDNGTGTITMMETARILKKLYPNPKRTIIVGLWGSEEQGLNGSSAFVEDRPEVVEGLQALFNQDNGTGRVVNLSGQGFLHAYEYLGRWMEAVPESITRHIETTFPGSPGRGGSDYASFVAAGAPAFSLSSLSWSYWNYTWHTNLDTYDKIVFDDVRNNVILTAILAYMASEDPEKTSREKAVLSTDPRTGEKREWPTPRSPNREGGVD